MYKRLDSIPGTSKSRSVDHGFTAPFDLDALRNKVEGRFESVDKLSREKSCSLYCSESFLYCPTYSYGNEVCIISLTLSMQNIKRVRVDRFGRQEVSTVRQFLKRVEKCDDAPTWKY
ncbi:hypothetical protein ALC57_15041 [Trachymyrmex cornetzi]|uniref:Uncharacterized protein n=1 Tax=Trachymyrmex cornetzi TaxID=471704 RepID=A0A195DIN9_9HYME|nr:hypothetical protein ALC57_15041 [Trachymyrmex cornetzi]